MDHVVLARRPVAEVFSGAFVHAMWWVLGALSAVFVPVFVLPSARYGRTAGRPVRTVPRRLRRRKRCWSADRDEKASAP